MAVVMACVTLWPVPSAFRDFSNRLCEWVGLRSAHFANHCWVGPTRACEQRFFRLFFAAWRAWRALLAAVRWLCYLALPPPLLTTVCCSATTTMDEKKDVVPERRLPIDREQFEDIMKRRFFFAPAFSIYSGVAGLYDYGPPLTAIKANLLNAWRNHFILEVARPFVARGLSSQAGFFARACRRTCWRLRRPP